MLEAFRKVNVQDDPTIDLIAAIAAGNAIIAECVALDVRAPTWINTKLSQLRAEVYRRKQTTADLAMFKLAIQVGCNPDVPF